MRSRDLGNDVEAQTETAPFVCMPERLEDGRDHGIGDPRRRCIGYPRKESLPFNGLSHVDADRILSVLHGIRDQVSDGLENPIAIEPAP